MNRQSKAFYTISESILYIIEIKIYIFPQTFYIYEKCYLP